MTKDQMHPYQNHCVQHILENPYCGLFLEMGLGKSVTTLTAINQLMYEDLEISKTLVIAPLRVAQSTWTDEAQKWEHLKHLRFSKVLGSVQQRIAALKVKADIYIINRENVPWLIAFLQSRELFDMWVIDELSSFKSAQAQRFKALRIARPKIKRVVGLTGTPAPNSLVDLWPQLYLLDMGERLGKTISGYRNTYFTPGRSNGHVVYSYNARAAAKEAIYGLIGDICISMKAKDYLSLPARTDVVIAVLLDEATQAKYNEFEKTQVLAFLDSEKEITAANAAALTGKLLQFANGAVYTENKEWVEVHTAKLDALGELIEAAQEDPILVAYSFIHDKERMVKRFKAHSLDGPEDIVRWNAGKIKLLAVHPASAGHGLNLQQGGHISVWYGQTWSLELYEQLIARLDRQGQSKPVFNYHLIAKNTMDEDVYAARSKKAEGQDALMAAVRARIEKYVKQHEQTVLS